jgi:hypothetical protein
MKKVIEADKYLNHFVRLKRIGYVALGKVSTLNNANSRYDVEVVKIESGNTLITEGSILSISPIEMKRTATVVTGSYGS